MDIRKLAIIALVFAQFLFGANFIASKIILKYFDPFLWSHIRFIASFILLGSLALILKKKHPPLTKDFILPLIPLSLLSFGIGQTIFLKGLHLTTAINASIISSSIPLLTLIIVVLRKQEKLTIYKSIGFILAITGIITLRNYKDFNLSVQTFKGDLLIFAASFCFAIFIAYSKNFFQKFDSLWSTAWLFLVSSIFLIPLTLSLNLGGAIPSFTLLLVGCILFTIIGATALTYFLNNWSLSVLDSGHVALLIYLQPVIATFLAWQFLGEQITLRLIFSSILIISGQIVSLMKSSNE